MLKDAGAAYVIVGHSERRTHHHETDALVRAKAEAALRAGLTADRLRRRDRRPSARRASRPPSSFGNCEARCRPAATSETRRRRLRAGLGDRHRPHADAGGRRRRCTTAIRALLVEIGGPPARQDAHSLWRLGQAEQLPRASWPSTMSTARWSAARASRPPISWPSPPPIAERRSHPFRWTPPLRRDRSAPSFEDAGHEARRSARSRPSCNPF